MVELIKEFVVNFELSRNAKEPRFSKRHSQQKKTKTIQESEICRKPLICMISLFLRTEFYKNLLLHKGNIVIAQFKNLATV